MRKTLVILLLVAAPFTAFAQTIRPGFNPSLLIPDASFADTKTFGGPEGIQRFLESKNSVLADTSTSFISQLGEPTDTAVKAALGDPEPSLGRLRTAAELIWDASQASGLNPQVIVVTLQKEQGLIAPVSSDRLPRALQHAMGFDCPDTAGCGNLFPGFYYQLFGNVDTAGNKYLGAAKSLMRSFMTPNGRGPLLSGAPAHVGDTVTLGNSLGGYDGALPSQDVTLGNLATAALYRYTPHVFNGNYNFWNFFTSWFKYPNGTLLRSVADDNVYIINDGNLQIVPDFVARSRGLHLGTAMSASPTELAGYPPDRAYAPADDTLVSVSGTYYVFQHGERHPVTAFVLAQRKLNPALLVPITPAESDLFDQGAQLTPSDGSIIRGQDEKTNYLVVDGVLKRYSDFTFKQYGVAKKVQVIPAGEIPLYPKSGYVAPKDGTLVKGAATPDVYVMSQSRREPLTPALFKNNGYAMKNVVTLATMDELASIPVGPTATPKEGTWFSVDKELYLFKNGAKHRVYPFVAKQRGITPDYAFESSLSSGWADGIAIPPRDGTLLRGMTEPTVYVVQQGQLHALTEQLFKLNRYDARKVVKVEDEAIAAFAKGPSAAPPENTYFQASSGENYVFKGGVRHRIYAFVAKQRGLTPDVTFDAKLVDEWPLGAPVLPRNGTLLKGDGSATTYLVTAGQVRSITAAAMTRRGYRTKNVLTVPQVALDAFEKGTPIAR